MAVAEQYEISEVVESRDVQALEEAARRHTGGRTDGLVPLVVIRPGIGRGKGKHLYESDMLREAVEQGRFQGWKMYVDHQSPEAKKAAGGLPRSMRELGGVLKEAWWDPEYPADDQHPLKGAVLGLAKPTRFMRSVIEDIPEAVGASISAAATAVRPVNHAGQQVWLVEGIQPKGSVDWVTEAGAGGKVIDLMEALEEGDDGDDELDLLEMLEEMDGSSVLAYLAENRDQATELLEAMPSKKNKKKKPAVEPDETIYEGGEVPTAQELIQEALQSEEGKAVLRESVGQAFAQIVAPKLEELVEAALEDERELMASEADGRADRRLLTRDLRDEARRTINESKLPTEFKGVLLEQYDIDASGKPTAKLDVVDQLAADGKTVEKTATEIVRESLTADIETQRRLVASVDPTQVRGAGPSRAAKPAVRESGEGEGDEKKVEEAAKTTGSPLTDRVLEEAGIAAGTDLWDDLDGEGKP